MDLFLSYGLILLGAFGLALVFTPLSRALAVSTGFVDHPKSDRVHWRATPYLGGLAVAVSTGLAFALLAFRVPLLEELWNQGVLPRNATPLLLMLATGAMVVGLLDDRFGLRPRYKLAAQGLLAVLFLAASLGFTSWHVLLLWPVGLLWMVGLTNAFNLLDGMDGILGGTGAIIGLFLGTIALQMGRPDLAALALAGAGAALGFLFFNLPPASIFLGDAGAFFIGMLYAAVGWELGGETFLELGAPAAAVTLALAYPIFDITFVTVNRIHEQRPIHVGGLDHTTHRLYMIMRGQRGLLPIYGLNALSGLLALVALRSPGAVAWVLVAVTIAFYATLGILLAKVPVRRPVLRRLTRVPSARARARARARSRNRAA